MTTARQIAAMQKNRASVKKGKEVSFKNA